MSAVVRNAGDIRALGEEIGTSSRVEVSPDQTDGFTDLTGDHQWIIHPSPERDPALVLSGSRVRMSATLAEATDIDSGVQVKVDCRFEVAGDERPACVARAFLRHHFAT